MLRNFCHRIALVNEWVGKVFNWLVIPLTFLVSMDVILSYVCNWSFMLEMSHYSLGKLIGKRGERAILQIPRTLYDFFLFQPSAPPSVKQ